jgi:hypothetical protein
MDTLQNCYHVQFNQFGKPILFLDALYINYYILQSYNIPDYMKPYTVFFPKNDKPYFPAPAILKLLTLNFTQNIHQQPKAQELLLNIKAFNYGLYRGLIHTEKFIDPKINPNQHPLPIGTVKKSNATLKSILNTIGYKNINHFLLQEKLEIKVQHKITYNPQYHNAVFACQNLTNNKPIYCWSRLFLQQCLQHIINQKKLLNPN